MCERVKLVRLVKVFLWDYTAAWLWGWREKKQEDVDDGGRDVFSSLISCHRLDSCRHPCSTITRLEMVQMGHGV